MKINYLLLSTSILLLAIVNLLIGSVKIPVADICRILLGDESHEIWTNIIWKSRLPQVLTAIVAGAGLAVSGLQMQTVFRNPLAGPSVLGISNGSALGVAFVVLLSGKLGGVALSRLGYLGDAAMSVAAIVGALAVMMLILWVAQKVKGNVTLLIIGVMIGYLANAIIGVLKFLAPEEDVKSFVVLMPATMLCGAALALVCNFIARMPGFEGALPVNSVTALVGAPVIAAVLFRRRKDEVGE